MPSVDEPAKPDPDKERAKQAPSTPRPAGDDTPTKRFG